MAQQNGMQRSLGNSAVILTPLRNSKPPPQLELPQMDWRCDRYWMIHPSHLAWRLSESLEEKPVTLTAASCLDAWEGRSDHRPRWPVGQGKGLRWHPWASNCQ